jgi:hypothetical protein
MGKKINLNRREYLSLISAGSAVLLQSDPVWMMFKSMINGMVAKAHAAELGQSDYCKSLYFFGLYGGLSHYQTLTSVQSRPGDPIYSNSSVGCRLTQDSYTGPFTDPYQMANHTPAQLSNVAKPTYVSHQYNHLQNGAQRTAMLPYIWHTTIPQHNSSSIPMTDILKNAMIVRGVDMQVDMGHQNGTQLLMRPIAGLPSLTGLIADYVSKINNALAEGEIGLYQIPSLAKADLKYLYFSNYPEGFSSEEGSALLKITSASAYNNNWLEALLDAFKHNQLNQTQLNSKDKMDLYIQAAMNELKSIKQKNNPLGAKILDQNKDAESLFKKQFGNLQEQWSELTTKYINLSKAALSYVPFIIPANAVNLNHPNVTHFATQFSLAEFCAKQKLVASANFHCGEFFNTGKLYSTLDEHGGDTPQGGADRQKSAIVWAAMTRSLMTHLNEFKRSIGPEVWNNMLVCLGAEFGRSPREEVPGSNLLKDSAGSDHSPLSQTVMYAGGCFKNFVNIGNVSSGVYGTNTPYFQYRGSWAEGGVSTLIKKESGNIEKIINKNDLAATVAHIVGIKSPVSAEVLVESDGTGGFRTRCEDPRNKDN